MFAIRLIIRSYILKFDAIKKCGSSHLSSWLQFGGGYPTAICFTQSQRVSFSTATETMHKSTGTFKFSDYDCIGFDLDNTIARYKVGAMIEMEYKILTKFLVEKKGYSKQHLMKPVDHNFILKGLIIDDINGNLLRISSDGTILQASHGTKFLTEPQILDYYPNRHWIATDLFTQDPLKTWNGPVSEHMRTLLDYFDIIGSLIFARCVDWQDEIAGGPQKTYTIYPQLLEGLQEMFSRENFKTNHGEYFPEMKDSPDKYYYKCSERLLNWLVKLKQQGKLLFLITGSHVDFANHTASNTIGKNWRDYFDIVICYAKKPGFFNMRRDFLQLDGYDETVPLDVKKLAIGGIYTQGNFTDLQEFLKQNSTKENPKFLYVGDNLIQDVYAPNVLSHCDTVAVCEELEAEREHGYEQWHPDEMFLTSTEWGSYFQCNGTFTNWYHIMENHSKLCVPSIEYVAAYEINHEFKRK